MPTVHVNGIDLYYETSGEGPPLVFIHGLGSSTRDWRWQTAEFSGSHRVVTFDLRGHGQSDKPAGPYTLPMFASDAAGLLKALDIENAHVVGVSLGGGVAFQLVVDYPEMVRTLTIVNSGPAMGGTLEQARQEIERRVAIVQQVGMRAMGEALAPNLFPGPEQQQLRESFIEQWAENDPEAYIASTRSMLGWDVTHKLGSIRCPTLVISADQDYTPVALKEAYVKLMPDARLVVIPDAHHGTPIERPEEFNAVLGAFLEENS